MPSIIMPSAALLLLMSALPVESLHSQVLALRPRAVSLGRGPPLASFPTSRTAPLMMMISVESASPLLADLPDQFAAVLESVGVSPWACFFICQLILLTAAFFSLKKDNKDLKQVLKKDIKDLSKTFSMQQQLNTAANTLVGLFALIFAIYVATTASASFI